MAVHLYGDVDSMVYDRLISGITPAIKVASGTIKKLSAAATYIRGTVLAKSNKDGLLYILGTEVAESSQEFNGIGESSQAFNGNTEATTFTITAKPLTLNSVKVADSAVTISSYDATTGVVTLASAPASGTGNVVAYYTTVEAKTFTVTAKPSVINSVKVAGSAVTISSYDATTGNITLAAAPAAGTENVVAYYTDDVMVPYGILCDNTAIGIAADVVAAVYVAGCFDPGSLTVDEDYTMTTADKDALRNGGCYLAEVFDN